MSDQPRNKFRVLLVDDDEDTRAMYGMALAMSEFDVIEARDGASALALASEALPDVIVTDLTGPGLDGFELVSWLQANPRTARIQAIVVTGWADQATRARTIEAGAAFLPKPCL
ncbi:MAG: response regulator, partial [Acidobacteriota bacterium]|nr:response regulator [Acidobacteriota bacterium]